jgi:hypothetical protein
MMVAGVLVLMGEKRHPYRVLVWKPEGKEGFRNSLTTCETTDTDCGVCS